MKPKKLTSLKNLNVFSKRFYENQLFAKLDEEKENKISKLLESKFFFFF